MVVMETYLMEVMETNIIKEEVMDTILNKNIILLIKLLNIPLIYLKIIIKLLKIPEYIHNMVMIKTMEKDLIIVNNISNQPII